MNALESFAAAAARGMAIIADVGELLSGAADAVAALRRLGLPRAEALALIALHETYFGPTTNSAKQRRARGTGHGIGTLLRIEQHARRVKDVNKKWDLRVALCAAPADSVDAEARRLLAQWRQPAQPVKGVKRTFHANGLASLRITADAADIQDIIGNLDSDAPVESFLAGFFGGAAAPARAALTTNVLITLEEMVTIASGQGDDLVLQLTNGATITGLEYMQRRIHDAGFATLLTPAGQAVALGRTQRFANEVQRMMLMAETPVCPWDDCRHPADECQVHHIVPWSRGGATDLPNLTLICPFHNGWNDDAGPARHGHLARSGGVVRRIFADRPG